MPSRQSHRGSDLELCKLNGRVLPIYSLIKLLYLSMYITAQHFKPSAAAAAAERALEAEDDADIPQGGNEVDVTAGVVVGVVKVRAGEVDTKGYDWDMAVCKVSEECK
ncbi:unnamed protein product [Echinostoma caproni]|uniref:Uncharacterized protein n=1 Tax=Echinostoma caproni TaxID=27848 RepID=A0A183AWN0_9TREM|nr:unnamed protein product [Echinostoma caproni]